VNRRNGTSAVVVTYRELAPSPPLRDYVRSYYSFTSAASPWCDPRGSIREVHFTAGDSFCSPRFADGHTSLVVELGATCSLQGGWSLGAPVRAYVIGALRSVGAPAGSDRPKMIGAYLEPGATAALLEVPAVEFTDRVVSLDDVWGSRAARLAEDLADLDEPACIDRFEAALLQRLRCARSRRSSVDVIGLARWTRAEPASMSVRQLADAAGVSRQHLTRVFREVIGVSPKRYCRLERFHAGLAYAGAGAGVPWAEVATELGYADQSHMIAEFRELSSLTPDALATQRWFHPFILEAQYRMGSGPSRT
jgi:AraC-like DNA-binding protein